MTKLKKNKGSVGGRKRANGQIAELVFRRGKKTRRKKLSKINRNSLMSGKTKRATNLSQKEGERTVRSMVYF